MIRELYPNNPVFFKKKDAKVDKNAFCYFEHTSLIKIYEVSFSGRLVSVFGEVFRSMKYSNATN